MNSQNLSLFIHILPFFLQFFFCILSQICLLSQVFLFSQDNPSFPFILWIFSSSFLFSSVLLVVPSHPAPLFSNFHYYSLFFLFCLFFPSFPHFYSLFHVSQFSLMPFFISLERIFFPCFLLIFPPKKLIFRLG